MYKFRDEMLIFVMARLPDTRRVIHQGQFLPDQTS